MAYISTRDVKDIRKAIRKAFPIGDGWKWSITVMDDNVGVTVALMQYPRDYKFPGNLVVDHHNPAPACEEAGLSPEEKHVMIKAGKILMKDWWVQSEQKGTGEPGSIFYPYLRIGTWAKAASKSPV